MEPLAESAPAHSPGGALGSLSPLHQSHANDGADEAPAGKKRAQGLSALGTV